MEKRKDDDDAVSVSSLSSYLLGVMAALSSGDGNGLFLDQRGEGGGEEVALVV